MPSDIQVLVRAGIRRLHAVRSRLTRYDLHLMMIPSVFGLALLVSTLLQAPTQSAVTTAGILGALVIFDGLFRNPPRTGTRN